MVNPFAVDDLVMKDQKLSVSGHADIELRPPESGLCRCFERSKRIAGISAFLTVPITPMGYNAHSAVPMPRDIS